ncbi:unnamed protein product [Moneuplotes crassus]|uniref:Uncharacterized protein n=1 Tax=Euplotes crassus TaxID=5936 RepID=A0AAD1Y725_EUPCR|nr:unnamed protein product [Moneuplotes crassus]
MYEHPIKRAGLSFSRILYSNTKAVQAGFPPVLYNKFNFNYTEKLFSNGLMTSKKDVTSKDLDEIFPAREETLE